MWTFPRGLAVVGLVLCLGSCRSIRAFEGRARPHGGHDGAGNADHIYFELRGVVGYDDGPYALVLPADWPGLPEGSVSPELVPGAELEPAMVFEEGFASYTSVRSLDNVPLTVRVVAGPFQPSRFEPSARRRLAVGGNDYALVKPSASDALFEARVWGATLDPAGKVRWRPLTSLRFDDRRGAGARVADGLLRTVPDAVATVTLMGLVVGAGTWPVWGLVPLISTRPLLTCRQSLGMLSRLFPSTTH